MTMKAILTFHSIDDSGSALSYPPKAFASLLEALAKSGPTVLGLDELLREETKSGITITFDDGMRSVFTDALPVLRDYSVPAHLFLATCFVDKKDHCSDLSQSVPGFDMLAWADIERMHAAGICIESHTNSHPDLRELNGDAIQEECAVADDLIEARLGRRPQYFAYPFGYQNDAICAFVRNRYKAAVTTELRFLSGREDAARLPRLDAYYLQNHWLHRNLDSAFSRIYLSLRSLLRTLRNRL